MKQIQIVLLLIIVAFIAYGPSLGNSFVWDDEQFIYRNEYVRSFNVKEIFTTNTIAGAGEVSNYYRPFTTLSFAIDYEIWGLKPFGFHLTNLVLHLLAGISLFFFFKSIKLPKIASAVISLIFLIHPIQTESVVYVNSRGDSLYSLYAFLALLSFSHLLQNSYKEWHLYDLKISLTPKSFSVMSVIFYAASILSKEIGIAIGGLFALVFLLHFSSQKKSLKKYFNQQKLALITFILLTCTGITYIFLRATILNFNNSFNFYEGDSLYAKDLLVRLLTFSKVILIYLRLLFFPYPLHMERETDLVTSILSIWPWITSSLIALTTTAGIYLQKQKGSPWILFGFGWFLIMLLPVSGIIPINGILYEHWLYVPMIGIQLLIYVIFHTFISERIFQKTKRIFFVIGTILISLLTILTIRQNYLWGNPIRFYNYLLKYSSSARIHNNLAMAYAENDQSELALFHYDKALEVFPYYPQIHHNKANTYAEMGQFEEAEFEYKKALEISPNFYFSTSKLLELYLNNKEYDKAIKLIDENKESPIYRALQFNKLSILIQMEEFSKAESLIKELSGTPLTPTEQNIISDSLLKLSKSQKK